MELRSNAMQFVVWPAVDAFR